MMKKKNMFNVKSFHLKYKIIVLVLVGIFGSIPFVQAQDISMNTSVIQQSVAVRYPLTNPFAFKNLGPPIHMIVCDVGSPPRPINLKSDEARAIINKVFEEEGIYLEKNYLYKKDSITAIFDGFSPDLNIGYVWFDSDKTLLPKYHYTGYYERFGRNGVDWYFKEGLEEAEKKLGQSLEYSHYKEFKKEYAERFKKAKQIANQNNKITAYRAIIIDLKIKAAIEEKVHGIEEDKIIRKKDETHRARRYFEKYLNSNSTQEEKEQMYIQWNLRNSIEDYIIRFDTNLKQQLRHAMDIILAMENEVEKQQKYRKFHAFLTIYREAKRSESDDGMERVLQVLKAYDSVQILDNIQRFVDDTLNGKFTIPEINYLNKMYQTKEAFIARIPDADERFTYMKYSVKKVKKMIEVYDEDSGEDILREIHGHESRGLTAPAIQREKEKALKRLETQVRQYIKWAKRQG